VTQLRDLIDLPDSSSALATRAVAGLCADSRKVKSGDVFFAIPGTRRDGLGFVAQAVERGASAIVAERAPSLPADVAFIAVADARAALSRAAARLHPRQPATIAAVTGTSGKTSVAAFTRQIWARLGLEAASLGTIGIVSRAINVYGSLTTPDPIALHQSLDELACAGVTHLALEASSHGLDQKRLDGVRLAAGAFTNLSRDHLDYHENLAAYLAAKLRLFDTLLEAGAPAVIDADSDVAAEIVAAARRRGLSIFTVGAKGEAIRLLSASREGFATRLSLE
jgi:UDP-N-acetylmuramoyl-L-alanyl-D-glutamate--2,6-diaminopimelate ligase